MRPVAACGTWWLWWAALEISGTVQDNVGFQKVFIAKSFSSLSVVFILSARRERYDTMS